MYRSTECDTSKFISLGEMEHYNATVIHVFVFATDRFNVNCIENAHIHREHSIAHIACGAVCLPLKNVLNSLGSFGICNAWEKVSNKTNSTDISEKIIFNNFYTLFCASFS